MKKLLFLLALILMACSPEAENETPDDPIIGSWHYKKLLEYPAEGEVMETRGSDCFQKSTLTFSPNGDMSSVHYHFNAQGQCEINERATTTDLSWERISEGKYRISGENGSTVRDLVDFPNSKTMRMFSYSPYTKDGKEIERKADVYFRLE
ncbi:lipocalin family protein [Salegentibacter chungangensis]|uniref:Lipocalin family protein n=1 Tax=Salegentibacter chungangensis TaxID=1335724 RepID=A0ABW3NNK6_9FLAO